MRKPWSAVPAPSRVVVESPFARGRALPRNLDQIEPGSDAALVPQLHSRAEIKQDDLQARFWYRVDLSDGPFTNVNFYFLEKDSGTEAKITAVEFFLPENLDEPTLARIRQYAIDAYGAARHLPVKQVFEWGNIGGYSISLSRRSLVVSALSTAASPEAMEAFKAALFARINDIGLPRRDVIFEQRCEQIALALRSLAEEDIASVAQFNELFRQRIGPIAGRNTVPEGTYELWRRLFNNDGPSLAAEHAVPYGTVTELQGYYRLIAEVLEPSPP
jgi:hypothetical protein